MIAGCGRTVGQGRFEPVHAQRSAILVLFDGALARFFTMTVLRQDGKLMRN